MTQQYTPNLGELCTDEARRDAIHIAVAPVIAGQRLNPGNHVGLVDGVARVGLPPGISSIGVVDPFLGNAVEVGQRFWLFLYPNTVTSLRHVWTHPSFKVILPFYDK